METFPNITSIRPLRHITPSKGWINDPNGFVYFLGEYHIYAQHYPYDTKWGPMHWLHFKSKDMLNWEECGISLMPSELYDFEYGCFSGSSIVVGDKLYVYYTGVANGKQTQCLAISEDGYHFKKHKGNPILDEKDLPNGYQVKDFRDPKVFIKDETFYMLVVARHENNYSSILLYSSVDPYNFKFVGVVKSFSDLSFEGMAECPDIIYQDEKCALLYSLQNRLISDDPVNFSIWYQVGDLNLKTGEFAPKGEERKLDEGFDAYSSQTISKDNKNYIVYWESCWGINFPSEVEGYVGQLSLFKEIYIDGDRLKMKFLEGTPTKVIEGKLHNGEGKVKINNIELTFNKNESAILLSRRNPDVDIVKDNGEILDRKTIHINLPDTIKVEYSYDRSCVELSINDGMIFTSLINFVYNEKALVNNIIDIDLIQ